MEFEYESQQPVQHGSRARNANSWLDSLTLSKGKTHNGGTQYLTIHFELEGKQHITFTGSIVLMNQLKKYESHLPFISIIKKINRHYTFS